MSGDFELSKSQLARYENGALLPPLKHAEHLDRLYDAGGWVEVSLKSLWRSKWNPWLLEHGAASRYHAGMWPAQYGGVVWVKLKPLPEHVGLQHAMQIEWGPWIRQVDAVLPEQGVVLLTGKAIDDDGIARTCNLTSDSRVFALFGAGDNLNLESVIDLRRGWRIAPGETSTGPAPELAAEVEEAGRKQSQHSSENAQHLRTELQALDERENRLLDALSDGDLPRDKIRDRLNRITMQRASIETRLQSIRSDIAVPLEALEKGEAAWQAGTQSR